MDIRTYAFMHLCNYEVWEYISNNKLKKRKSLGHTYPSELNEGGYGLQWACI